jgi:hypothetical protein
MQWQEANKIRENYLNFDEDEEYVEGKLLKIMKS